MNEIPDIADAAPALPRTTVELAALRNVAMLVYVLQALSFIWGLPALVGVIINYVKREDARGTIYESHIEWQIRSFWWGLLWVMIGFVLAVVLVGFVVLFIAWMWMFYRVVKGWLKLTEGKPVYP